VIVRWGIDELEPLLGELGVERALLVTTGRFASVDLPVAERFAGVRRHSPVETVAAMHPYYVIRMFGGLLYLSGALIMVYNLWMTVRSESLAEAAVAVQPGFAPAAAE